MRTSMRAAVALLTIFTLLGLGGAVAGAGQEGSVTICHRTNSNHNPYVVESPSVQGQNGAADHLQEHQGPLWDPTLKKQKIEWGDVIAPIAGVSDDPSTPDVDESKGSQAYQELEEQQAGEGQAFIDRGCHAAEPPVVPTHGVTLDKATTGGTAPTADTEFTFTVECESGDVTSPVSIAPADDPVSVATGVAEDDLCTITETGSNGAETISFSVTGGTKDSSTASSVTVAVGADSAVLATNAYPEPVPENQVEGKVIEKAPAPVVKAAALPKTGPSEMTPYYAMAGAALLLAGSLARFASRRLSISTKR
ncbi:MAG: DUF5979 domain-containing protein [Acidimicrobiales bacterium]